MKKLVSIILLSSLLLPSTSSAAIIQGSSKKCKVNTTKVDAKYKYVCISSGIWKKTALPVKVVPIVPRPTPTPTPSPTISLEPVAKPETKVVTALDKVSDYLKTTPAIKPDVTMYISENAEKRNYNIYLTGLNEIASVWGPLLKSPKLSVVMFTEQDSQWIDQIQTKLMGSFLNNPTEQLQSYRLKDAGCNIYGFYLPGVLVFCVKDNASLQNAASMFSAMSAIGHEYSHLVGMTSLEISQLPLGDKKRLKPCWVEEGGATFWGISMAYTSTNYSEASKIQFIQQITTNVDYRSGKRHGTFMDSVQNGSIDDVIAMMKRVEVTLDYCTKNPVDIPSAYFLGMLATEYLVYNFGVGGVIEFNKSISDSTDWKGIFLKHFNMSVDDFYIKLVPYMQQRITEFDIIK